MERASSPCIADLKLGTRTWDRNCDERKLHTHKDIDAASTTSSVGWRFCGVVLRHRGGAPVNLGKNYGVFVAAEHVVEPMLAFLTGDPWHYGDEAPPCTCECALLGRRLSRAVVAQRCRLAVERLRVLEEFLALGTYTVFAASAMLVYDGARCCCEGEGVEDAVVAAQRVSVTLIDYAHVWDAADDPGDSGALVGVRNLIALLTAVAEHTDEYLTRYYHAHAH